MDKGGQMQVSGRWIRGNLVSCCLLVGQAAVLGGCLDAPKDRRDDDVSSSSSALTINQAQSVMTQRNDAARSGANLHELTLAPAGISNAKLGRLYTRQVVGSILAQPLYLSGVDMGAVNGLRNVVVVATNSNHVYAFDADETHPDPAGLLWHNQSLGTTNIPTNQCGETRWPIGITSTPVFDPVTGALFVVTRTTANCTKTDATFCDPSAKYLLRKIDVQTGNLLASTEIQTANAVSPAGGGAAVFFNPLTQLNRPGLLLMNGAVYIGFGTLNCDQKDYQGWVFGYRASDLAQTAAFVDATDWQQAGIWQSGQGLAGDPAANAIYLFTANGSNGAAYGDSALKLSVGPTGALSLAASHIPLPERDDLDCSDTDLGAGAPALLPNGMLIGGGKQGLFYLLAQSNLVQQRSFQAAIDTWHLNDNDPPCDDVGKASCATNGITGVLEQLGCFIPSSSYQMGESLSPNIHGGPAFWQNGADSALVYLSSEKDYLKAFQYQPSIQDVVCGAGSPPGGCLPQITSQTVRGPNGMPGGFNAVSANGQSGGVVWTSIEKKHGQWVDAPGVLIASDAATLHELWRDNSDVPFTKFMPVTVAGGKIFRASMAPVTGDPTSLGELIVYGALPATTWTATTIGGPGAEFVADSRGRLFAITPDQSAVMAYMGWGGNWLKIGGPAQHLYAGGPSLFMMQKDSNAVLRWDDPQWTVVGGAGAAFAVDDRGTLYGLSPDKTAVNQFNGQSWTPVRQAATSQIWGGGLYLFATTPAGDVFRYGPEAGYLPGAPDNWVWRQAGGPGAAFAADGTGRLYGLTPDSQLINAYNGWDQSWRNISGAATSIAAGGQRVFRVAGGLVSVFDEGPSTSWINTGVAASRVVARGDMVAAIDPTNGNVSRLTPSPANPTSPPPWQRVEIGLPGSRFTVDSIGNIYGLTPGHDAVYKYQGVFDTDDARRMAWAFITGGAASLVAGGSQLFSVDPVNGNIRRYDGTQTPVVIGDPGAQFIADDFGTLYAITPDKQKVTQYTGTGVAWNQIWGPAVTLYAGGNKLYAINPANNGIYRYNGTPFSWTQVGGPGAQFAVDGNGTLYGLTPDKQSVNRFDGAGWPSIGGAASAIFARGGLVVAFDPSGQNLYHFDLATARWDFVAAGMTPVMGSGVLLGVDNATGNVYRYWRP
jgi:hypothetical protein